MASVYALVCGLYIYKAIKWRDVPKILWETATATAVVMIIMGTVASFNYVLSIGQIPKLIATTLLSITSSKYILLLMFNIIVIIAGMFMNPSSAIILLTPILLPALVGAGINPILVGIIFVVNLGVGTITPPVGSCLYVACHISKISYGNLVKACVPYMIALFISLLLITYVEPISLWLVNLYQSNL